jgi:hypothetical protein
VPKEARPDANLTKKRGSLMMTLNSRQTQVECRHPGLALSASIKSWAAGVSGNSCACASDTS